jgi:hypothetical protein
MEGEVKNFKAELYKIAWFMRGGINMSELFESTREDREIMAKIIKENLDVAKKTGQPFF